MQTLWHLLPFVMHLSTKMLQKKLCLTGQQTNMFCMTNRHLVTLTRKTNPGFWWLMTGVLDIYSKKKCCLPPSLEKKHWPIWITDCVDWWCLCHLLLSLWADSVCGFQSEPEVSSQSHSLSFVVWNIHCAALGTLWIYAYFLCLPTTIPDVIDHNDTPPFSLTFYPLWYSYSNSAGAPGCKLFLHLISVHFKLKIPCGVFGHYWHYRAMFW